MIGQFVHLLGHPEIRSDSQHTYFVPGQVAQLLTYLAYSGDWVRREKLTFLFWPDQHEATARRNLRKLLHRARQHADGIEAEGELLRWLVPTDVQAWCEALTKRNWEKVFRLYRGPLLEGLDRGASREFSSWLEQERERAIRTWRSAVLLHAEELEEEDPAEAARLLRRFLEVEPLDEETVRRCLACLARAGRREELEEAYREFAQRLESELELEPEEETRELVAQLRSAGRHAAKAPPEDHAKSPGGARPRSHPYSTTNPSAPGVTAFVGREKELGWLDEHLGRAQGGRGGAVAIEGEAGIGKTRLVEEFLSRAADVPTFVGRCFERELGTPLEPVHSALSALGEARMPQLKDGKRFWTADPHDRSAIHRGLTALLVRTARRQRSDEQVSGAILFIDDLQWADAATLEFLSYAAKRVHNEPVLIIVSYRREDQAVLENWLAHLAERRAIQRLGLRRLEPSETHVLLAEISRIAPEELAHLAEFVHRESEGNPFYIVEYLRWLHDSGVLERDERQHIAHLHWEHIQQSAVPEGVRTLIWARYQALEERARWLLDLAAVIGRTFELELLERASGRDPLALWSTLEPLIASGLIVGLPEEQYAFSHDKLRQTIYGAIGPPVRRALHARVAEALQQGRANEAELAHHYLRAQAWPAAFRHLEAAAEQADGEHAWEVALQAHSRALEIVDRLPDAARKRFAILQAVERLLEYMDRRPEWVEVVEQLVALAQRLEDPKLVAEAELKKLTVSTVMGDRAGASAARGKVGRMFADLGDEASEARAYRELAYAAWIGSDYQGVLAASFEALRIYRRLGNRRAEAAIAENISHAHRWLRNVEEAVEWGETAAAIYQELGDLLGEYLHLDTLAWMHLHRGNDQAAAPLLERLLTICEKLEDKHLLVEKHINLGQFYLKTGEPRKALSHFETATQLGAETGDARHESYPLMSAGATLERLGEPEAAAQAYRRAAQLLETAHAVTGVTDDLIGQAEALTLHAAVLRRQAGREEEALASFAAAEAIYRRHREPSRLSKLLLERGALYWHLDRHEDAAADYRQALEAVRRLGDRRREAAALASLGVVYRELGRLDESIEASSDALERLLRLGDPLAEAYVLSSLAASQRLAGRLEPARECLRHSLELRRELGDEEGKAAVERELARLEQPGTI